MPRTLTVVGRFSALRRVCYGRFDCTALFLFSKHVVCDTKTCAYLSKMTGLCIHNGTKFSSLSHLRDKSSLSCPPFVTLRITLARQSMHY